MDSPKGEWRTCRAPNDKEITDSFVTFTTYWPVIGLLLRDGTGQIWLGWANLATTRFEVSWQNLGGHFVRGPFIQAAGTDAVVIAARAGGDLDFAVLSEPYEDRTTIRWQGLSLTSHQDPVSVSWSDERIDIFGKGNDGVIRQTWLQRDGHSWAAESQSRPIAETTGDIPSAVSWGPRRLDLFGRSRDGLVIHKWWDDAADRFDIFNVENTSKTTHKFWHPGTGWLPAPPAQWEDIGGPLTTPISVVSWGSYRLDIFGRGPEGHLRHLWWNPENGWEPGGNWEDMHGVLAGAPIAFTWGPDRLGIFALSVQNTLIFKYRDPGIFWRPSLTRWYEGQLPGSGHPAVASLRAAITPEGTVIISAVDDSLLRAHIGIFRP